MIQDIAPHQYDVTYRRVEAKETDKMLIYKDGGVLCHLDGEDITYPTVGDIASIFPKIYEKAKFLFRIDEEDYFELHKPEVEEFGGWSYLPKEKLRSARPIWKAYAGITGYQIHKWYTEHGFCGCCGAKLVPTEKERALQCQDCGKIIYPQICPSVIVGIVDGERILMTKYADRHNSYKKYALVAGYNEIGESLEDTVRREVMEEVGLRVKNIRYYKSQPWSFSDALLVGFFCEVDGTTDITLDEEELSTAEWFPRNALPKERSDAAISLTGEMVNAFRDGYNITEN